MSSSADAPGGVVPGPEGGQEGEPAHPGEGGGGEGATGVLTRRRRRRLVTGVTALAVVAAAVGLVVAFASHPAPAPAATGSAAARPAALANEAAATVAVVKTTGSITGGPVLSRSGQLWMVELSQATGQPMLAVVDPVSYAVTTHPLPASLGGLSLRYTGAEAFDNLGQLWLGATSAASGRQPAGTLVRYTPASGAIAQFSLGGNCSDAPAARPAQLFTASDGGVWVECAASQGPAVTFIARLSKDGVFTLPTAANTVNPPGPQGATQGTTPGTPLSDEFAGQSEAEIGPLVSSLDGEMWGATAGGYVQFTAAGAETFTPTGADAVEMQTEAPATVGPLQLVGNVENDGTADPSVDGTADSVEGVGECRAAGAGAGQAQECVVSVNSLGNVVMLGAPPDSDGHAGTATVHPAAMDASGDVWFIVDGTDGGRAPQGQYFFEMNPGGGSRVIPFSVPGDALPVPTGQVPVITAKGAVWTADPQAGPGTLVEVMPEN